ncbi:sugar phosphate nucleotidyltransferase [Desulfosporosinus sp. OT]|uniref:sugar phosphate nucleotidyltransferase n=1 Tax=Desulfosporosinus sp. OT TaxID=913865 RepID=UPI0003043B89|nr:sugar phosphate nucleotidyltransferase [Desulfosporosinus sp. OT]
MRLILLSGGSGKRLWPLSNDARSKQFLKVLLNERGELESMVQRVWSQLESTGLGETSYIATSKSQLDMIQNQLGSDMKLIVEPERRDTFPAIALASTYLYSVEGVELDEVVVVLPVDPYVDESFFERVKGLEQILEDGLADLALMGVVPTYPSEKYGYIVPEAGQMDHEVVKVSHFREKPTEEQAQKLISQQAMWNCGVFAFKLGFVIAKIRELGFATDYEVLREHYGGLPKISFDYQVVEKTKDISALRYDGEWKDLGTWNTLTEEMSRELIGNGIISEDSKNTHLVNELDIPVTVLGLSNIVVAASPDGILVSDKGASPRVKEVVSGLDHRPMFEERRWGWYKVLEHTTSPSGQEVLTKRIGIKAGKNLSYQMHYMRSEVWTIVSGTGEFVLDEIIYPVKAGDVVNIPVQAKHGIRAVSDLEFIEVQMGRALVEEDIVRLFMTWDEVEERCVRRPILEVAEKPA